MSGLQLFGRAFRATQREIWVSLKMLAVVTLVFAVAMYIAEHSQNPEFSFVDALVWTFVKYVEDPADIVEAPVTLLGKVVGTLVGVLGIAIFAVPAGLIGSGLMDAMAEEKREEMLKTFRRRMRKAFRRSSNRNLRIYLDSLPDGGGDKFKTINLVPANEPVVKLQVQLGMDLKDIIDTCNTFPEFRLKNMASAYSNEEMHEDRLVVEHFPINRKYGCCLQRGSKVTIICTTSVSEPGIGRFTYYLAKFGGFNYICKELTADADEPDSFYNLSPEPLYDRKPLSHYTATNRDKDAIATLHRKQAHRDEFLQDLSEATKGDNTWAIIFADHLQTSVNQTHFHLSCTLKDGSQRTVSDEATYSQLCDSFATIMKEAYGLECDLQSSRFPLLKKNLCYTIRGNNPQPSMKAAPNCNAFVLRPASKLINFDVHIMEIAFRMAQLFSTQLDGGRGISDADAADLATTGFGYAENV